MLAALLITAATIMALAAFVAQQIRRRHMHPWLPAYLADHFGPRAAARRCAATAPLDVLLCIADHFEPSWAGADESTGSYRVGAWMRDYPRALGDFRDSSGRPPRHTFFFPIDQYISSHVDGIASLCAAGFGEVEIHLHHDRDTAANLERTLRRFTALFVDRHGLLGRWPDGRAAYGFIHGNWALDNSHPRGHWCGVDNELDVLVRTGCYADFTMPSAPDATQTRTINRIYYANGRNGCRKSHDRGVEVGTAPQPPGSLMLIQGPLCLWRPRPRRLPRIENGCIQRSQPLSLDRLDAWLRAGVHVPCRPDWLFVKLHTHGAVDANRDTLLGPGAVAFHQALADRAAHHTAFRYHYVTARELYNLARAAESGYCGPVEHAFDFEISPPRPDNATRPRLSPLAVAAP